MLSAAASAYIAPMPCAAQATSAAGDFIGRQSPLEGTTLMTPENLWAMGRIGDCCVSPDGKYAVYAVTYYSVRQNRSHTVLYRRSLETGKTIRLTQTAQSESRPTFLQRGGRIAFLSGESGSSQLWAMNADGTGRKQLSHEASDVLDYLFSPDQRRVVLIKNVPCHTSIAPKEADLPLASGRVINELMYKHWDSYVDAIPHPFLCGASDTEVLTGYDLLEGQPYECPMLPFGGVEQLAWSPDGKTLAYTCRKKTGRDYATSTDSDIFLYTLSTREHRNMCKPATWEAPHYQPDESLQNQEANRQGADCNMGYDQNPQFSPDGKFLAWTSMERDGYESDRARLCVLNLLTGEKHFATETLETGVNDFVWLPEDGAIALTAVWHGRTGVYLAALPGTKAARTWGGEVVPLTADTADYSIVGLIPGGKQPTLLTRRESMKRAPELFTLKLPLAGAENPKRELPLKATQITDENHDFYQQLAFGEVKERWVKTTDGQEMLCWVVLPPHFAPARKYPALLFCEGGPQSPVSQFWSYRWNMQIMAANGYIVIAPNRRGLPGFGMKWLEQISGDYSGQCMQDYLSAIDDLAREPWVDENRLGAVGASFGGYSVYWLAGNHHHRFKAFIAHDGIYNTGQQYVETEELWFPNWDMGSAPWKKDEQGKRKKAFETSPHLYVDRWDTPILCIHGQRDFRIEYTQAESAFTAARMRGVPAQLLLFPDENHWVLKPQNGILWQRTFFRWLDRWLKAPQ